MSDTLLVERRGHTTVFTLNRPDRRNAYNEELVGALKEAMADFDDDPDQYVGILTGAGDVAFCSGRDIGGVRGEGGRQARRDGRGAIEFIEMWGVGGVSKPMIAAINGLAVGGGLELALNCDIRLASDQAWFGLFEPKRGIVAGVAVHLLPRMISYGDAAWLLLTAERVSAAEAHRMGLVQRVVSHESLLDEALALATSIGKLSQVSVQATKRVMSMHRNALLSESVPVYREVMARVALAEDRIEGMRAFAEKREPNFPNRWPGQD
jgi:enoyl-CoA hydratase/carnithine racemase